MGGTYDPPHHGHIHLALSLAEAHKLDEVWICPAWTNPHKQGQDSQTARHRLAMTRLAFDAIPSFHVLDIECQRPSLSYTVDTLRILYNQEQQRLQPRQLFLLLGEDCAQSLPTWHHAESILDFATPLIGARSSSHPSTPPLSKQSSLLSDAIQQGWTPIPLLDISSTALRQRLKEGQYCKHLIPPKVVDYIYMHELY